MYKYHVYNNLFWIFLIQMEYRLQSMYNHMVGRAASFVSLFYSIFLGQYSVKFCRQSLEGKLLKPNKVISSWHKHVFSCEQRQETCSSDLDAEHSNAVSRYKVSGRKTYYYIFFWNCQGLEGSLRSADVYQCGESVLNPQISYIRSN